MAKSKISLTIITLDGQRYYWYDETDDSTDDYLLATLPLFKKHPLIGVKLIDGGDIYIPTKKILEIRFGKECETDSIGIDKIDYHLEISKALVITTINNKRYYWTDENENPTSSYLLRMSMIIKETSFCGVKTETGKDTFLSTDKIVDIMLATEDRLQ
ncbi:MAG: hypothetical protein HQK52_22175 [Oligoflexia bacterium]|nr:hypothetical protein [Oligoflexia bacterium]